jgi:hypothetical protein
MVKRQQWKICNILFIMKYKNNEINKKYININQINYLIWNLIFKVI